MTDDAISPLLLQRKIIHFDMDAFYAAVEVRDDPSLRGKPVVIGGSPQSRAVVCTASYEARKFGITSAMPCSRAQRLCQHAIFIPPHFEKYAAVSAAIRAIFHKYTDLIEPLSLDEAFLDVTHNRFQFYATKIAKLIQEEIWETLRLTGSAGVAPNKLLAKIASDMKKPYGLTVVLPAHAQTFMGPLPLRKIHGIGPVTEKRLHEKGFQRCKDVWPYTLDHLIAQFGNLGAWLYHSSRGLDTRPVLPDSKRKSIGQEETLPADTLQLSLLERYLESMSLSLAQDLQRKGYKSKTITLKVKYFDFKRITRSKTLTAVTDEASIIFSTSCQLLKQHTEAGQVRIRLIGISLSNFD